MCSIVLADVGPPKEFVQGFLICSAVGGLLFVGGIVWLGLWLAKRSRSKE